jgi:hypothetical protein
MESIQFEKSLKIPVYDTGPDGKLSLCSDNKEMYRKSIGWKDCNR